MATSLVLVKSLVQRGRDTLVVSPLLHSQSVLGDCRLVGEQTEGLAAAGDRLLPEAGLELEAAGLDSPREPQWIHSLGREATGPADCRGKT